MAVIEAEFPKQDKTKGNLARINRGNAYLKLGQYKEAIDDFRVVVENDPNNTDAYYQRGDAHLRCSRSLLCDRRDYAKAIADFNKAIQIDRTNAAAYVGRGIANDINGNFDDAIEDFKTAIDIDAKNAEYCNRYLVTASGPEREGGIRCASSASRDFSAHMWAGDAHLRKCDYASAKSAIADFNKAIEINPKSSGAYVGLGRANEINAEHDEINAEHDEAIKDFDAAIDISGNEVAYKTTNETVPKNDLRYYYQGVANEMKGEYPEALADFDRLVTDIFSQDVVANHAWVHSTAIGRRLGLPTVGEMLGEKPTDGHGDVAPTAPAMTQGLRVTNDYPDDLHALCAMPERGAVSRPNTELDMDSVMTNGLGKITPEYRLGPYQSGINFGAAMAVRYYQTNWFVRKVFIGIYFVLFFLAYDIGKHILYETLVEPLKGGLTSLRRIGVNDTLPIIVTLKKISHMFSKHILYVLKNIKRLTGF